MENYSKYLDVEINIDKNKIKLNDIININISIKNMSKYKLQNGLFRLNINETILKLVDKTYEHCINNYGNIGNLKEKFLINISVPVKVVSIPSDLKCECYCDISFNMVNDNNEIEDVSLKSKIYDFYFESPRIFERNNFIYTSSKRQVSENNIVSPKNINKKDKKSLTEGMKLKSPVDKIILINKIKPVEIQENAEIKENNKAESYKNCCVKKRNTLISTKSNFINESNKVKGNKNRSYVNNPNLLIEDKELFYKDDEHKNIKAQPDKYVLKKMNLSLDIKGEFSDDVLILNEIYTYKLYMKNDGDTKINQCQVNILLEENVEYVSDSLYIDDKKIESENLTQNINIGEVDIGEEITISYDFKVINLKNECITMNCEALIESNNKSKQIKFKASPLNVENKSLEIIKCISNECVHKGEIIKIQNILNNIGTVELDNILLKDNENINLEFVKDSITIDGEKISEMNPVDGISINKLNSNENVFICYEYEFNPKKYLTKLVHYSDVYYSYKLGNDEIKQEKDRSEKKYIDVEYSIFKQLSLGNEYSLENTEPDIFEINSVFSTGKIDTFFEANSIKDKNDNENLCDDKKVIIKGTIINRIEYTTNNNKSSLYLVEKSYPFVTVIDVSKEIRSEYIDFKVTCENSFFKVNNKRSFLVTDLILVEGIL